MTPYFSPMNRLWLDYGGVFAVANVRGGGEYGEPWHLAGNLTQQAERVRRLRRVHALPDRIQVHECRTAWRSWAAATAA